MSHKSYVNKEFGEKKAQLEEYKLGLIQDVGGWFGLPHVMFHTHYYNYVPYLVPSYPFFAVERDRASFNLMRQSLMALENNNLGDYGGEVAGGDYYDMRRSPITGYRAEHFGERIVKHGDLFEMLFKSHPATKYIQDGSGKIRKPQYSYGHLDFCCTAVKLTDEHFEYNLRQLAQWWNLKSPFHLDITVALRGDKNRASAVLLFQHTIPTIFQQVNWKLDSGFVTTYADTQSKMMTGLFIFHKDYRYMKNY